MNSYERKPLACVFIYLILSTHPIQLCAIHQFMTAQMKFKESLQQGGGAGVFEQDTMTKFKESLQYGGGAGAFDKETISMIEQDFEDLFRGFHAMKERIDDMSDVYENSDDAKEYMSFKDAPWQTQSCGLNMDYSVKTLREKAAELLEVKETTELLEVNETSGSATGREEEPCLGRPKSKCNGGGCRWKTQSWPRQSQCVDAVDCTPCSACTTWNPRRAPFYKKACDDVKGHVCDWVPGHPGGTCKPKKCEALRLQAKKLETQVNAMTGSVKEEMSPPSKRPSSKKNAGHLSLKEIKTNTGRARLFQKVQDVQQNAEEGDCAWFKHPKEGDPNFKAMEDLMGQKQKTEQVKKCVKHNPKNKQCVVSEILAGAGEKAATIPKKAPKGGKYSKVEGRQELKDEAKMDKVEDEISAGEASRKPKSSRSGRSSKTPLRIQGRGLFPSRSSKKPSSTPKHRRSLFSGWHHKRSKSLLQAMNSSSELLFTGELVSTEDRVVSKDGFAFCLIPFLGWGFCSMVAFLVVTYLFIMFVACLYTMMFLTLPLMGLYFCGMLKFVHLLWQMFQMAVSGHWEPDHVGILDKCMPFFTWPLHLAGPKVWISALTCMFGPMR